MKLKNGMPAYDISLYIKCVFYSGRMRTLFTMTTSIFHRLIMVKVKIDNFYVSLGIFGIYFYRNVYLEGLLVSYGFLSKSLNLIGYQGDKKGKFY